MNATKHTPGEWHTEIDEENWQWPTIRVISGDGGGWTPICKMQANRGCNRDETSANARLIAAAPELLSALKETLDALYNETAGQDESPWIAGVKARARKAIEGATQ